MKPFFILTPFCPDTQMKETVDKFKTVITTTEELSQMKKNWGMQADTPFRKKSTGFYLLQFDVKPSRNRYTETQFRRDERVLHVSYLV